MPDINQDYLYLIYDQNDKFLGVLQNVISEFSYPQDMNSNAVHIDVTVKLSADTADLAVSPILDEAGNPILDENGLALLEERAPDVFGNSNPLALVQGDNIIKVWEISQYNINGKLVFDGFIENGSAKLGGTDESMTFGAYNKAIDMVDYLIEGVSVVDVQQNNVSHQGLFYDAKNATDTSDYQKYGQSWLVGPGIDNLSVIALSIQTNIPNIVTINVYSDAAFTNLIGTVSRTVPISSGTSPTYFFFSEEIPVVAGVRYYFSVSSPAYLDSGNTPILRYRFGADDYANGNMFFNSPIYTAGWQDMNTIFGGQADLYFATYSTARATKVAYINQDPGWTVDSILINYNAAGGLATDTSTSVQLAGYDVDWTFRTNTVLEGIEKMRELAPAGFYYYVDPATNILYFKQMATTPVHVWIKGRHLNEIEIGFSNENIRNVTYVSGGDDGSGSGENVFVKRTNTASFALGHRRRLERLNDINIEDETQANLLGDNFLDEHADTDYICPISVIAGTYDFTTVNVGDTVSLRGYGNFIDSLLLQVARKRVSKDRLEVVLGVLMQRQIDTVSQTEKAIAQIQTIDNPAVPS